MSILNKSTFSGNCFTAAQQQRCWSSRPSDFLCAAAVWLHQNVKRIRKILASPLQGGPSRTNAIWLPITPIWNWSDGQPVLICVCVFFLPLWFRSLPVLGTMHLHPGCRWSWQRLISFVFLCLSGPGPARQSSPFSFDEIKTLAFEENLPQWYIVGLIATACQLAVFLDPDWLCEKERC